VKIAYFVKLQVTKLKKLWRNRFQAAFHQHSIKDIITSHQHLVYYYLYWLHCARLSQLTRVVKASSPRWAHDQICITLVRQLLVLRTVISSLRAQTRVVY